MSKSNNSVGSGSQQSFNPSPFDILCGQDKTYAKNPGNRVFRERIDAMKMPYSVAPSKQEKMAITREIVAYMQMEHGSRFLKLSGGVWVEISTQAARDKVSHALRFAARNIKASAAETATKASASSASYKKAPRHNATMTRTSSDDSSTTSSTSDLSDDSDDVPLCQVFGDNYALFQQPCRRACEDEQDDEPVPLSQVFGDNFALNPPRHHHYSNNPLSEFPAHPMCREPSFPIASGRAREPMAHPLALQQHQPQQQQQQQQREDELVACTRHSLNSLFLSEEDDEQKQREQQDTEPLDPLQSSDLDDLLNRPMSEWEMVAKLAEC